MKKETILTSARNDLSLLLAKHLTTTVCKNLKEIAIDAFETMNWILGNETGGVEGPEVFIGVEELEDGSVALDWKHPETCGLSDVRHHYEDLSVKRMIFKLKGDVLTVGGRTDVFESPVFSKDLAIDFFDRWNLAIPVMS